MEDARSLICQAHLLAQEIEQVSVESLEPFTGQIEALCASYGRTAACLRERTRGNTTRPLQDCSTSSADAVIEKRGS